jgi:hypothetical protein
MTAAALRQTKASRNIADASHERRDWSTVLVKLTTISARAVFPMRYPLMVLFVALTTVHAQDASEKIITGTFGRDLTAEATTSFRGDTPKLYLRWHGQGLEAGDKVRCIWIAEDVGNEAPVNYHIDDSVVTVDAAEFASSFTLTRPKNGWPNGKYRAEIYIGDRLTQTFPFTIEPAAD